MIIVSRGEWLGRPANFKGAGYCLAFEVETGCHVTYITPCITPASIANKMAEDSDLFYVVIAFPAVKGLTCHLKCVSVFCFLDL